MLEANEANEANDVQTSLEARQYCHLGKGNNAPCHSRLEALISKHTISLGRQTRFPGARDAETESREQR